MIRKIALRGFGLITIFYFVFLTFFGFVDYETKGEFSFSEAKECFRLEAGEDLAAEEAAVKFSFSDQTGEIRVIPGGELFGVRMQCAGLLVTAVGKVETEKGALSPGETCGIKKGDVLCSANGVTLGSAADFVKIVSRSDGKEIRLGLKRNGESLSLSLLPLAAADGSGYKAGLWVRDGAAGIGTVTFQDPESGVFAGLGHGVCDGATGILFPLGKGEVCDAGIEAIKKGENGKPGELSGKLSPEGTGEMLENTNRGVYGKKALSEGAKTVPIAPASQVKKGKATILCTLDETGKQEYEIEIEEIFSQDRKTKNFILRITSPALLSKTGGIVQGMSGSPILQDGHLIGAVTHVLVNDPTRGYGIFIENMLDTAA